MDGAVALAPIQIGPVSKPHLPLVLGGSIFGGRLCHFSLWLANICYNSDIAKRRL
jgi:hypothetical protein